jgi:hypothetical protein
VPHTSAEFERDWRRLSSSADKRAYLRQLHSVHVQELFRVEIRSVLLIEMLRLICDEITSLMHAHEGGECHTGLCHAATREVKDARSERLKVSSEAIPHDYISQSIQKSSEAIFWGLKMLQALSSTGRFNLNLRLISSTDKHTLGTVLQSIRQWADENHEASQEGMEECVRAINDIKTCFGASSPVASS